MARGSQPPPRPATCRPPDQDSQSTYQRKQPVQSRLLVTWEGAGSLGGLAAAGLGAKGRGPAEVGAPSRRGATSNWGLPEGGHQAVREPGASGGFQREGTRPSESRERLGASRGPGGPGSPGPEDRSPSPRLPAGPAGTRRARTRLSLEPGGCSPPAGHSPWTQDGQHSPSTNQGSAHVAGGQLIWWQTVLNFYEEKRHFPCVCVTCVQKQKR